MLIKKRLDDLPWFHVILPLVFFLVEASIIVFYEHFEFDPDEGINLIKAFLVYQDHQLFQDVWSDQPPLLTNLLVFLFKILTPSVDLARGLILVFSAVLLWQIWLILYLLGGVLHAYIGCFFLLISHHYWRLSVSVMIGFPSLTLALGAFLSVILWHVYRRNIWLVISALLLCLSAATKMFTLFLAPIIFLGIAIDGILNQRQSSWSKKIRHSIIWSAAFIVIGAILLLSQVGIENIHFLVGGHASARDLDYFQGITLGKVIKNDYRIFIIGLTIWGTIIAFKRRQWQILYFTAWSASSFFLLINHRPVWYHHAMLLTIPTVVMVGYTLGEIITTGINPKNSFLRFKKARTLTVFTIVVLLATMLLVGERTRTTLKEIDYWLITDNKAESISGVAPQFLAEITRLKPQTDWIVTDSPIFAFRAGLSVPPSTAVLSQKQLRTGNITEAKVLDVINTYQPQQIFFRRFPWEELTKSIQSDYQLIKQDENSRLYVRKSEE
ncbi:MAG: hypothetical protein AAFR62_02945 [Cyanobacteria bacterium J06629_2]